MNTIIKKVKKIWDGNKYLIIGVTFIIIIGKSTELFYKSKPQIYTIGKLIKIEAPVRGDLVLVYTYNFQNKIFEARTNQGGKRYEIGKRYFVSIPEGYPSHGWLMVDKPVPDSIKEAPPEGWKELPVKFEE